MKRDYSSSTVKGFDDSEVTVKTYEEGGRYYHIQSPPESSLTSVTTVLSKVFGDPFPEAALPFIDHARERGIEWHRTISLLSGAIEGVTADIDTIDPEVLPRVLLVRQWMKDRGWVPKYIERAFWCGKYGIAGTPDQVGHFEDDPEMWAILDFKPWLAPRAALQLAGYSLIVRECLGLEYVPKRISLHVGYRLKEIQHTNHHRDKTTFLSALNCYNYGEEKGLWLES
jgi:hypothetical protein